jgi:serine/threonine protein kinase
MADDLSSPPRLLPMVGTIPPGPTEPFGKYRLHGQIGQGGMAEVWLASLQGAAGFEKPLVLKRILPELLEKPKLVEMFIREAKISSGLQHANLVQIYELGEVDGRHYIAMEYVRGIDLYRLLFRAAVHAVEIPLPVSMHIVAEVLRGLDHAHRALGRDGRPLGLVHHDVSPSNILLSMEGAVKVADFGVARARLDPSFGGGSFGALRGKLGYLSPEQVEGKTVDLRSDVFAAGICLYELLTRKRLFRGKTAVETLANVRAAELEPRLARHPELPDAVQAILRRALARSRDRRYQGAREFIEAIESYLFEKGHRVGARDVATIVGDLLARPAEGERSGAKTGTGSIWTIASPPTQTGSIILPVPRRDRVRPSTLHVDIGSDRWIGPFSLDELRAMLTGRRLTLDQGVSVDGGPPIPAREAVQRLEQLGQGLEGTPHEVMVFDRMNASAVLARLAQEKMTGRLVVLRETAQKEVSKQELWFKDGKIVRLGPASPGLPFGNSLVDRGFLTFEGSEAATQRAGTNDLGMAPAIVRLGLMAHADVLKLVSETIDARLGSLFRNNTARAAFYTGGAPPPDPVPLDIDIIGRLSDAARRWYTLDELKSFFTRAGNPRVHLRPNALADAAPFRFQSKESRILRALDGPALPVDELISEMGDDEDTLRALLTVLFTTFQAGLLAHVARLSPGF